MPKRVVSAVEGVEVDLKALPAPVRRSALAAQARALARRLDDRGTADRDAAALSRELRLVLGELRALAQATPAEVSAVDELRTRREARRG